MPSVFHSNAFLWHTEPTFWFRWSLVDQSLQWKYWWVSSYERWGIAMTLSPSAPALSASVSSSIHGKIVKAKDHVQFDINFYSESFHICYADSLCCPDWLSSTGEHSYISFFVIFFMFWWCFNLENKSANALALCHPPSASFCSVLAGQWCSRIFTHDRYNILSDILTEFEVNLGIIIEKYAETWSFPLFICIIHWK